MHKKRHLDFLGNKPHATLAVKLQDTLTTLGLPAASQQMLLAAKKFPFLTTRSFLNRIQPGDPNDPLLQQILPSEQELISNTKFCSDPLAEAKYNPVPGLLHKYKGRALITITNVCLINCRYCFRKEFSYQDNKIDDLSWQKILNYLQQNPSIKEIILSGGDPLTLNNTYLAQIFADLASITHLEILRIHSRVPIVLPKRLNTKFIKIFTSTRLKPVLIVHCNHPNEINTELAKHFKKLQKSSITLLNQTVLLKGINDDPKILIKLSYKLFELGILPYYLHMLDPVTGTEHLHLTLEHAKTIITSIASHLPGYLVPRLVTEQAGAPFKVLL